MSTETDITITTLGNQGDGLAPYESGLISVPFALPGETIRVSVTREKEHVYGHILEILNPSPARITPPCPVFGSCGGCRLQHMDDASYRAWKLGAVNHLLEKNGFEVRSVDMFVTPPASRRRASFAIKKENNNVTVGFHARESHTLIPITACHVLKPQLTALIERLRAILKTILENNQTLTLHATIVNNAIELVFSDVVLNSKQHQHLISWGAAHGIARLYHQIEPNAEYSVLLEQNAVIGQYGNHTVTLPPHAFMQASDEAEAAMVEAVAPFFKNAKHIADLFCGTGLFALNLYDKTKTMLAVDVDGAAVGALHAATQNLRGFKTARRNLFRDPLKPIELKQCDAVCIDPPRAGAKEQISELARTKVKTIAYVSCNPTTFIRDARILTQGGYTLHHVQVFDQFLWSHHIEMMGVFTR